ncbi:uncharacterized protein EDB91DRAFT_1088676 [Suillus paluster]|uniref:uncharacterized protein n=1 Tax=Suillus paluster TaxID=48578 RepID=UPI001B8687E5|nr:uncharacterized protein EDB91DRAFT_1088676 [Suillus paluster]KAG1720861.1 hypothetical protein EDB91DRAFT_1088676 [Suillus paluster]
MTPTSPVAVNQAGRRGINASEFATWPERKRSRQSLPFLVDERKRSCRSLLLLINVIPLLFFTLLPTRLDVHPWDPRDPVPLMSSQSRDAQSMDPRDDRTPRLPSPHPQLLKLNNLSRSVSIGRLIASHSQETGYHQEPVKLLSALAFGLSGRSRQIAFGTLLTRGPPSPLVYNFMKQLHDSSRLLARAASNSGRAAQALNGNHSGAGSNGAFK